MFHALERLIAPLPAERVLQRLERDGHLVATARCRPWKQILLRELDTAKPPYACVGKSSITADTS